MVVRVTMRVLLSVAKPLGKPVVDPILAPMLTDGYIYHHLVANRRTGNDKFIDDGMRLVENVKISSRCRLIIQLYSFVPPFKWLCGGSVWIISNLAID